MSCSTTPGSRAAILLAQHTAPPLDAEAPVSVSQAQHAYHSLLREARSLQLRPVEPHSVERWFDEARFRADLDVESSRSRSAIQTNLDAAWREWKADPGSLSAVSFHAWRHTPDVAAVNASRADDTGVVVAYDCDGVLYDFNDSLREWLAARGWQRDDMPEPHTYSLKEAWGLDSEELRREMPLAIDAGVLFHTGIEHRDGTVSARAAVLAGHRVVVNTARAVPGKEEDARAATVTWLRSAGVHPDVVHVADPADPADKLSVPFDVLLDDHPGNVQAALDAGRGAYLVDRKWNRDAPHLPRVTFDDVPELLAALSAEKLASRGAR